MSVFKLDKGDGELTQCDQEAVDVLNVYFASVFEVEEDQVLPTFNEQPYAQALENIVITNSIMKKAIGHVNSSKSASPDLIYPNLIKQTQVARFEPLTGIFQKSVDEGAIPEVWKCANVTAIFKSGEKSKSSNYRPISLTSVPGKIMERTIRDALVNHMTTNNLVCDEQHCFIKREILRYAITGVYGRYHLSHRPGARTRYHIL